MNNPLLEHIKSLKSALLLLPATGETGFEGLIAEALCEISGVPFRLAKSGSQFGVDGRSAYEEDTICFEGKRYDGSVPREKVLSKIAEISISNSETDIWILGATSHIGTQLADDLRALGIQNGISVLILDWSETKVPPLAVALAMGETRVEEFLKRNVNGKKLEGALSALKAIRGAGDFASHADRIRAECTASSTGLVLAQRANVDWLSDAFASRRQAKKKLGQPLSPNDTKAGSVRQRNTLTDALQPYFACAPEETVVFVLGGEGNGKSWIIAQSWLALEHKPLMVFMAPDDFTDASAQNNQADFLVSMLIKQTGDQNNETTRERWRRRLKQWRNCQEKDGPRLIIVVDGINQRPKYDWGWTIDGISEELKHLGGRLIVTSRTPYFRNRVKSRLSVPYTEISIPEWTESERNEIMAEHNINASEMHRSAAASLRNPRLLGIALELLDTAAITDFEELTVSRLLFEHMRISERDALAPQHAPEFARQLQNHAQEIVSRIATKQKDDLYVFEEDMGAVADGRFYQTVDGDPTRYSLKDDGLTLALGFALIDRMRTAKRNDRSLDEELNAILDPISALDNTADVLLAALTVNALSEYYEQDFTTSLVKSFAILQNPDNGKFPAFCGLAKKRPQGFMEAAQMLSLTANHWPNFDWIHEALIEASRDTSAWKEMTDEVHSWMSAYSLSPERSFFAHLAHDQQDKVREEREKNRQKIEGKLQALSPHEKAILESMREEKGNLRNLSLLALQLLAGKPLAPFVNSLLKWSFSYALNSGSDAPDKEFMHLVSFNRIDWSKTRASLARASVTLRGADVSTTGKWALVLIWRATGDSDDAREADSLVDELTKDRRHFGPWRLVEDYCATDPCDPVSEEPANLKQTAEKYAALPVSQFRRHRSQTVDEHFLDMARPCVARFKPEIAVAKHRELAADVLNRTGSQLLSGLFELQRHNALLTVKEACELTRKRDELRATNMADDLSEQDAWIVSQYSLLLAFPFLSALEQAETLLQNKAEETVLLDLMYLAKPLDEKEFERLFEAACNDNSEPKQYLLLSLALYTSVPLSANARALISALFLSESKSIRTQVLGVIAQSVDEELLRQVVASDWRATASETDDNYYENWYGSIALLEAAVRGLIAHDKALERISERLYDRAATLLNKDVVHEIARRIDASINQAAGLDDDLIAPDIEIQVHPSTSIEPERPSLNERKSKTDDPDQIIKEMSESDEAFEQRQRRNHDAFLEFKSHLTKAKARIILNKMSFNGFAAVIEASEELADRWYKLFRVLPKAKLPIIHNLVLLLAHTLANTEPSKANDLFGLVRDSKPLVRFTFGRARVQLDATAIWAGTRSPILDELRCARLDRATSDHDLSIEVLAALLNNHRELLVSYIESKLQKEEPAEISRGVLAAGFSDQSDFNDKILQRYEEAGGLIGRAQKAAKYAYERNIWARYWFGKMCQTEDNKELWRYKTLFSKIVDGRFDLWGSSYTQKGPPLQSFELGFDKEVKSRLKKWEGERKKKFFGSDVPRAVFLEETHANG